MRTTIKSLMLVLFFMLVSHLLVPALTHASEAEGIIRAIEVEGLTRIKKEELIDIICFHDGIPLDRDMLREGIKRAFKKGIFLDITAVADKYKDGVKLTYIVKEIPIIKKIKIHGNRELSKRKIRRAFLFKKGDYFREDLLEKARTELQYFYYKKGFPYTTVEIETSSRPGSGEIVTDVVINEGQPLVIEKVSIPEEFQNRIKISKGDYYDTDVVDKDIERLKKYLKKHKHIRPVVGPYKFKDGELSIPVDPGPKLEIVFKGKKVFSAKRLLKEVPFLENEEVSEVLLKETIDRIRRLYQREGYYHAQISGGIERENGLVRVIFLIFTGKRVMLREIKFDGVTISIEALKDVLPFSENRIYNRDILDAGKDAVINFYRALGFLYADVTDIREEFLQDETELNLVYEIEQGPRITIQQINIAGNNAVSTSEIERVLQIENDDPYNEIDIGDARYRILSVYSRLGYINAEVEIDSKVENKTALITFNIRENDLFVFGKVIIRGNEKTKRKIIWRELTIKEGEPYNYEAIFKTRQRLYNLGIFSEIKIEPIETSDLGRYAEDRDTGHKQDIFIDLKEGRPGAIEFGAGYGDYERLRGFIDISYSNLGGYNRLIGLRAELSSIEERYILNFREPWLFNKPELPLTVTLTKEDIRSINLDTKEVLYKLDRLSFMASVDKKYSEHLKGILSYEYSIVETFDVKPGIILSKEDTGTLGISSISPSLYHDTRDNPFDPTSGSLKGIVLKYASHLLLSDIEFIKVVAQSSWYFELRKGLVFAFALKGGIAEGFEDKAELPIIERFFLGGRTTVRGFKQDTLGPKGVTDNPTGGNIFALTNAELRISLGKGFGIVAFVDGGNVWTKISDMDSELRYTTGGGLRYNTPVGPLRLDYGHKIDQKEGESAGELHFSFGHAF